MEMQEKENQVNKAQSHISESDNKANCLAIAISATDTKDTTDDRGQTQLLDSHCVVRLGKPTAMETQGKENQANQAQPRIIASDTKNKEANHLALAISTSDTKDEAEERAVRLAVTLDKMKQKLIASETRNKELDLQLETKTVALEESQARFAKLKEAYDAVDEKASSLLRELADKNSLLEAKLETARIQKQEKEADVARLQAELAETLQKLQREKNLQFPVSGRKAFTSLEELRTAVDAYLGSDEDIKLAVQSCYGKRIGNWDVSNITSFRKLFDAQRNPAMATFNEDISGWDTSNAVDMSFMFAGAAQFNSRLDSWNVSKCKNMYFMFYMASSFRLDLSKWDTSQVCDVEYMFVENPMLHRDHSSWYNDRISNMRHMSCDRSVTQGNVKSLFREARVFGQEFTRWVFLGTKKMQFPSIANLKLSSIEKIQLPCTTLPETPDTEYGLCQAIEHDLDFSSSKEPVARNRDWVTN